MIKRGKLRGEKVKYPDGNGYCIWYPFPKENDDDDEDSGLAFDIEQDDIDDVITLLQTLKVMEPEREFHPEDYDYKGGEDD